jgi:hypothetical protein
LRSAIFAIVFIGLITSGCQEASIRLPFIQPSPASTATATQTPAPSPNPTQTAKPSPTSRLSFAATPTKSEPTPQVWRFQFYPGGKFKFNDKTHFQDVQGFIKEQANNLSVPEPYFWEMIELPGQTRFAEIEAHYVIIAQQHGFIIGRNEQGETIAGENTYLMTFIREDLSNTPRVT